MKSDYLKTLPQYIIPKRTLTVLAGLLAEVKTPKIKNWLIKHFIQAFHVNMQEAEKETPEQYPSFNDFFIRKLKPGCRPIAKADIVSPVDGWISEIGVITAGQLVQAKGRAYSVEDLLGCNEKLSQPFLKGKFATIYLSPKDYHRIHMPLDAVLQEMIYIPGKLFSVQPATARVIPNLFARNERLVVFFDTHIGKMAMVLVGATIVGAIGTSWHGDLMRSRKAIHFHYSQQRDTHLELSKGSEMGYFKLGSTVILLFAEGHRLAWNHQLTVGSCVQLGSELARFR